MYFSQALWVYVVKYGNLFNHNKNTEYIYFLNILLNIWMYNASLEYYTQIWSICEYHGKTNLL